MRNFQKRDDPKWLSKTEEQTSVSSRTHVSHIMRGMYQVHEKQNTCHFLR